jgi:hypothetical protein
MPRPEKQRVFGPPLRATFLENDRPKTTDLNTALGREITALPIPEANSVVLSKRARRRLFGRNHRDDEIT